MDNTVIITIHGVGEDSPEYAGPNWQVAKTLDVPENAVHSIYWRPVLNTNKIGWVMRQAVSVLTQLYAPKVAGLVDRPTLWVQDILLFFLSKPTRDALDTLFAASFLQVLEKAERVTVLAHSLGSVMMYWFLLRHPGIAKRVDFVSFGSPLGSNFLEWAVLPALKKLVKQWQRPAVLSWLNLYSVCDPLSGRIPSALGIARFEQIAIGVDKMVLHTDQPGYLKVLVESEKG